ncbi:MAG: RluA family pseudouridine synthase [Candidatus Dormibacteraeota bacterium]|nr:RluA family pseudouridine synthase [Candidatus Dormibacteraeota bacterium]
MAAAGPRLDRYLADNVAGLTRTAAGRLAREGHVRVNGKPARPADSLHLNDLVEFERADPIATEPRPEDIPLEVLYQDAEIVVVVKPAGMVAHPAAGHHTGTLVHALLGLGGNWSAAGGGARPGLVHRLDKDTSGLLVAARTDAAHLSLSAQLSDRTMSRTYQAIAVGRVAGPAGVLEGDIGRHPRDRKRMAVVAQGRSARTRYRVLEQLRGHTLLRCDLDTGRTHQIRVHLAAFGHPIAGDRVYGGGGAAPRPMLHAWRLKLRHPRTGEAMSFEATPPGDFQAFLEAQR